VEAAAGDICGDQNRTGSPLSELLDELLADVLWFVSVDAFDRLEALLIKLAHEVVDSLLGLAKHENAWLASLSLKLSQQLDKPHVFLLFSHAKHLLLYLRVGHGLVLTDLDVNRLFDVAAVVARQGLDFLWPGGAEHECLPVGPHVSDQSLKLLFEAHVLKSSTRR